MRIITHYSETDDGLKSFAVWIKGNKETGRVELVKVEPYDSRKHYGSGMAGVVRAKDELGVYRFVESYNPCT